ncbi:MAG: hypothetical protein VYE77_00640, partial [Planctomycetota bacterium]|nr:hypothetical protein [Planctomycetota bacterium]
LGGGRFRVPPLPVPSPYVRIMDKDRIVLLSGSMPLRKSSRARLLEARNQAELRKRPFWSESLHKSIATLRPPQQVDVEVVSSAGPVAGARLLYRDRTDHRLWATSDANGKAKLLVPRVSSDKGDEYLRYVSFWLQGDAVTTVHAYAWDLAIPKDGSAIQWRLTLPKAYEMRGRVLWANGKPAANVALQLHTGTQGGRGFRGLSASFDGQPQCLYTDEHGRFVVPGRPGFLGFQLSMFLRDAEIAQLPRTPVPYAPFVVLLSGVDARGKHTELGDIVLSDYVPVDVTVTGDDGQPAASHAIHFRERLDYDMQEERVCYTRVDWQGRIRLLARPGAELEVSAMTSRDADDIGPPQTADIVGSKHSINLKVQTKK